MKDRIENVAIIGMGALGMLYGEIIQKKWGPESVFFVMDEERAERHKNEKCIINGEETDFRVFSSDEALPADLVMVAVKGTGLRETLPLVKAATGPETTVISLLNGITSEKIIGEVIPKKQIIDCVALGMDAVREGRELTYHTTGKLQIPKKDKDRQAALDRLIRFFDETGIVYELMDDIHHAMWNKFMLNVGINQVSAVYGVTYRTCTQPGEAMEDMMAAMREVMALSEEEWVFLTDEDFETNMKILRELNTDGIPSMRQDILAKRKTEVELFAGTVIEKARRYDLPVPVNKRLYKAIRDLEKGYFSE